MTITLITILNDFGKNMGRYSYSSRQTTDDVRKLEVSFLHKHKYFNPGFRSGTVTWTTSGFWGEKKSNIGISSYIREGEHWIRLNYTMTLHGEDKRDVDYRISLTTTPCNYGGERYWFTCPLINEGFPCGRRVGTLYLGTPYFGCRHCLDLTYESRNTSGIAKSMGAIKSAPELDEMRARLRQTHYNGKPTKRYLRYLQESQKFDNSMITLARYLGTLGK